jgi:hypothetical protein
MCIAYQTAGVCMRYVRAAEMPPAAQHVATIVAQTVSAGGRPKRITIARSAPDTSHPSRTAVRTIARHMDRDRVCFYPFFCILAG